MPTILSDPEESFWMDPRMSESNRGIEGILGLPTTPKSIETQRRSLPIFGCVSHGRQFGPDPRRRLGTVTSVLHKLST